MVNEVLDLPITMGNFPLTSGLTHVSPLQEIQSGEAFIVRFKNSSRKYNTDLWIGILLPDDFEHGPGLSRNPKGAKPVSGEWTTDLDKRVYPVYLPARNSYRWIPISDFFVIGNKPPRMFVENINGRDYTADANVYWELLKIVGKRPGIAFWQSMAKREVLVKGRRSKTLGLVLPDGFDDIVEGISTSVREDLSDDNRDLSSDEEDQSVRAELEGEPPHKVQAVTSSWSASRTLADQSSDETVDRPRSLTFPGENTPFTILNVQKPVRAEGPNQGQKTPKPTNSASQASGSGQIMQVKSEEEPSEGVNNVAVARQDMLFNKTWTLAGMVQHILLKKENSEELLAIFRDVSTVEEPELGKLMSFLKTQEFNPQLLKASFPRQSNSKDVEEFEIGDCLGIDRQFQLHGVRNSADLHEEIVRLGKLYSYARRLNMVDLVEKITLKLQAAWNSYPGLSQLEPLLEVAAMVFRDSIRRDLLQDWLIKFIADTLDLIYYQCPRRYWALMRDGPDFFSLVTQMRSEANRKNPERYANPRDQLRKRGIEDF